MLQGASIKPQRGPARAATDDQQTEQRSGWLQSSATINPHSLRLRRGWKYCVPLNTTKPLADPDRRQGLFVLVLPKKSPAITLRGTETQDAILTTREALGAVSEPQGTSGHFTPTVSQLGHEDCLCITRPRAIAGGVLPC
jgi:hypothetical protein